MGKKASTLKKQREKLYSQVVQVAPAYIIRWGDGEVVPCHGWEGHAREARKHEGKNWKERKYYLVVGIKFIALSEDVEPTPYYEVRSRDTGKLSLVPIHLVTTDFIPIEPAVYTITHHA